MKHFLLSILFATLMFSSQAQMSRMFFVNAGMSLLTDVHMSSSPIVVKSNGVSTTYQHFQWNYFSFHLGARMNILNLGSNGTLSLRTIPTLALGTAIADYEEGSWYSLGATVPVFVEYNFGVASRFSSEKNRGFLIGVGYEYNIFPLIGYNMGESITLNEFQKVWVQPAVELGYRYFNKKNIVKEVNLKGGIGKEGEEFTNLASETIKGKKSYSIRLSFSRIINY